MVDEDALADARGRVNIGLENGRRAALQIKREILPSLVPKPVRQPVGLDRMEALEIEHRHQEPVARRVAVVIGLDVDTNRRVPLRRLAHHHRIGLADQIRADIGMIEPFREAMDDRTLEAVVVENGGIEKRRQKRIAFNRLHRLAPDRRPDRIDRLDCFGSRNAAAAHRGLPCQMPCLGPVRTIIPLQCQMNRIFLNARSMGLVACRITKSRKPSFSRWHAPKTAS